MNVVVEPPLPASERRVVKSAAPAERATGARLGAAIPTAIPGTANAPRQSMRPRTRVAMSNVGFGILGPLVLTTTLAMLLCGVRGHGFGMCFLGLEKIVLYGGVGIVGILMLVAIARTAKFLYDRRHHVSTGTSVPIDRAD